MARERSILQELMLLHPGLQPQVYLKSALTALSHALEDLILGGLDAPLVIINCQHERQYRRENRRYRQLTQLTDQVYIFATPERETGLAANTGPLETIPLEPKDPLVNEWQLLIISEQFSVCMVCHGASDLQSSQPDEQTFAGIWTFDREVCSHTAQYLIKRIIQSRPELEPKLKSAEQKWGLALSPKQVAPLSNPVEQYRIFGHRLLTHLQASQYKLLKAKRIYEAQARKERLINRMSIAIRESLSPDVILQTAVQELGQVFDQCRCILYRCHPKQTQVTIAFEFLEANVPSLRGQIWEVIGNPLLQVALLQERATAIADVSTTPLCSVNPLLQQIIEQYQIKSWLIAPILHQGQVLGLVEIQYVGETPYRWRDDEITLVEAISTQAGVALSQAEAFTASTSLNSKLQELERTQTNLINIIGHELRTPLSTIQVCLESLNMDWQMPVSDQRTMVEMALTDTDRMQNLIQDFLSLFRLQNGQVQLPPDSINFDEALNMVLSGYSYAEQDNTPQILIEVPQDLPTLQVSADGLIEVLDKLLSNACKFTDPDGQIKIQANVQDGAYAEPNQTEGKIQPSWLKVIIEDTGRGIDPYRLRTIFRPFFQEEDYLRRSAGGTGLGLAICEQLVAAMRGKIWAESRGKNKGSAFHFIIPTGITADTFDITDRLMLA